MISKSKHLRNHVKIPQSIPFVYARALAFGFVAAALLLLLFSAICYAQPDPAKLVMPLSLAALYLSSLICGIFAGFGQDSALLPGLIVGGLYFMLIASLSLIMSGVFTSGYSFAWSAALYLCIPVCSLLGAFLTQKKKRKNSYHHKKRRF